MDAPPISQPRWRFSYSSTLRSIYVLRYFLFAGGAGIAGALIQRWADRTGRPLLGLLLGFIAGLFAFSGQIRAAIAPRLLLSQAALYLVTFRRAARLPWVAVREVLRQGDRIVLQISEAIPQEAGRAGTEVLLNAKRLGVGAAELYQGLQRLTRDSAERQRLPTDNQLQGWFPKLRLP